ncbi:spore germination protein (amino acid permease) [Paenibacillus sp. 1_12]|uniref:GerAB/ArcD/ProY family transporter n=1 Tax=Paenibacillus sp. 1_12 TaxID=1566278 RepID=UPI0008E9C490|nr:endospore germination permease [Paenibacillus sp. 1_12]SFM28810.1 spore germination protein (amino acid permease) [Paenibacillus sp. 1_12]
MSGFANNKITSLQYILINSGLQVSVFFLALPRILFEHAGTDGWISLIIGWFITVIASLAVIKVMSRQPDGTLLDLLTRYGGKWAGRAAAIVLFLYLLYFAYSCLIQTTLITKEWLLPQTSAYLIILMLLIPTYVIAISGIRIIGRYAEITYLLSLWIPFVYLLPLKEAHWLHLLPIAGEGWRPISAGVPFGLYCFLGFVTTFILYPFIQNKRQASKAMTISNTLTLLLHLFVTMVCYVYFSPDEIDTYNEPAINVLRIIEFKFVERIEVIYIAFYLLIFSLGWIPALYMCAYCTNWLTGMQSERNHFRALWLMLAVGSCFFMPSLHQNENMERLFLRVGIGVEYVFPIILLMCIWLLDRFSQRKKA